MVTPLVTIFTITRNRCDLLPRAMRSILNQTYRNIEYIIIDSASTDNTESVVKGFSDNRIRYVKLDHNETFGHCLNMAVHLAAGKYVTELDDDDEYNLDKIEKQVNLFESLTEDYGMVYCWMSYYDNSSRKLLSIHNPSLKGYVFDAVVEKPLVSGTPTLLFRKSIFDAIGGYKEASEIGVESDWEFACRICERFKVDYVPESLVNVFINHGHVRMSNAKDYYAEIDKRIIKFHSFFLDRFKSVFEKYPKKRWYHLKNIASAYYHLGQYKEGYYYYKELLGIRKDFNSVLLPIKSIVKRFINH